MPRLVVLGGSFNPPGIHHLNAVTALKARFDRVLVMPCGMREDKENFVHPDHRRAMVNHAFLSSGASVDNLDISNTSFMRTIDIDSYLKGRCPDFEIWHAVGTDLVVGGHCGESEIQSKWFRGAELWEKLNFAVMGRRGYPLDAHDFPVHSEYVGMVEGLSSSEIRRRVRAGEDYSELVTSEVHNYIQKHNLYQR